MLVSLSLAENVKPRVSSTDAETGIGEPTVPPIGRPCRMLSSPLPGKRVRFAALQVGRVKLVLGGRSGLCSDCGRRVYAYPCATQICGSSVARRIAVVYGPLAGN